MKIGIQYMPGTFSEGWITYCEANQIPWKKINSYSTDVIHQIEDCDAFMWHFYQAGSKDVLFAKQLLYALQCSGKKVFPDFNTCWHFDNKVGQKYLLEAVECTAFAFPSYIFYTLVDAHNWLEQTTFPKVFKLSRGAGSSNVRLVQSKNQAIKLVNRAFGKGFRQYNPVGGINERWRKYKLGKTNFKDLLEGISRFIVKTNFEKTVGNEKGYVYFQDFIPDNTHDIRVNYVYSRCFASRRQVRAGDFRASGSGLNDLNMTQFLKKPSELPLMWHPDLIFKLPGLILFYQKVNH